MNRIFLALVATSFFAASVFGDELRLDAKALYERSTTSNVRLNADGSIELDEGELIEDDGPAAGFSYKPNTEALSDTIWIKKELLIPNAAARKATLLIGSQAEFKAVVNGKAIELKPTGKVGQHWRGYEIPPESLKAGINEIILHGKGNLFIARAEEFAVGSTERAQHPGRSLRSMDAGKTWQRDALGPKGDISGEYNVRLFLDRHRPSGTLTLPVLDAGNLAEKPISSALAMITILGLKPEYKLAKGGTVVLDIRSGSNRDPSTSGWSPWKTLKSNEKYTDARGRFFQVRLELKTTEPLNSPHLTGMLIEAENAPLEEWAKKLTVRESSNPKIVRSSISFDYEPFDHAKLKELRKQFKLDDIVKDAKTEFELIERLAKWSASALQGGHLKDIYPAWDALEILKPHSDGRPIGGFCQQYNLVFLQACESFGIPGRAVSISNADNAQAIKGSGHEVVELWSNQFKKWIYVDGNVAWYALDEKTNVPLSLFELRQRQRAVLNSEPTEPVKIVELAPSGKHRWTSLTEWPSFQELRLIPRSNFLEQKAPLPLNQGMRGWFWTGHHVLNDEQYPASLLFSNRINDHRNWNWTINQAHIALEATVTPGELRVHLDTETPGFETFLATINDEKAKPVESGFIWKLKPGKNVLEIKPRNKAGREGIASQIVIEQ